MVKTTILFHNFVFKRVFLSCFQYLGNRFLFLKVVYGKYIEISFHGNQMGKTQSYFPIKMGRGSDGPLSLSLSKFREPPPLCFLLYMQ